MTRIAVAHGGVSIEVQSPSSPNSSAWLIGYARGWGSHSTLRQVHHPAISARRQAGDILIGIILIYD
jgi:hypothetical protein